VRGGGIIFLCFFFWMSRAAKKKKKKGEIGVFKGFPWSIEFIFFFVFVVFLTPGLSFWKLARCVHGLEQPRQPVLEVRGVGLAEALAIVRIGVPLKFVPGRKKKNIYKID
jgi:hypothetical protein